MLQQRAGTPPPPPQRPARPVAPRASAMLSAHLLCWQAQACGGPAYLLGRQQHPGWGPAEHEGPGQPGGDPACNVQLHARPACCTECCWHHVGRACSRVLGCRSKPGRRRGCQLVHHRALQSVGGLSVAHAPRLTSLQGLSRLTSVGSDFIMFDNLELESLAGARCALVHACSAAAGLAGTAPAMWQAGHLLHGLCHSLHSSAQLLCDIAGVHCTVLQVWATFPSCSTACTLRRAIGCRAWTGCRCCLTQPLLGQQ